MNNYPFSSNTILLSSYSKQRQASFSTTEVRSGAVYFKKSAANQPVIRNITFRFEQPKSPIFLSWFNNQLKKGFEPFDIDLMTEWGIQTLRCRFLPDSLLNTSRANSLHWQYTAQIMIPNYDAPPYYPDDAHLFPDYLDGKNIEWLDIIVNTQLNKVSTL